MNGSTIKESLWINEFGQDYAVDDKILALLQKGVIRESSWHDDVCPSFRAMLPDDDELVLWVDHPDPAQRDHVEAKRYMVVVEHVSTAAPDVILWTDSLDEALAKVIDTLSEGLCPEEHDLEPTGETKHDTYESMVPGMNPERIDRVSSQIHRSETSCTRCGTVEWTNWEPCDCGEGV